MDTDTVPKAKAQSVNMSAMTIVGIRVPVYVNRFLNAVSIIPCVNRHAYNTVEIEKPLKINRNEKKNA